MFTFKSLARKNTWYEVDCKSWCRSNSGTNANFADYYFEWDDCGDTGIQHSARNTVTMENAPDCLASCAVYLQSNPGALESECIALFCPHAPQRETVEFLAKLTKTTKERYFSVHERKVSSNADKRFDTRYKLIDDACNGSLEFVARCFHEAHHTILHTTAMTVYCAEMLNTNPECPFSKMPYGDWQELRGAFALLRSVIDAYRAAEHAKSAVECFIRNQANTEHEAAA